MVTIIANQLDNNYSQVQINALYTQCKKLIEDPFDFVVFVKDDEMDLLTCLPGGQGGYHSGRHAEIPSVLQLVVLPQHDSLWRNVSFDPDRALLNTQFSFHFLRVHYTYNGVDSSTTTCAD